MRADKCYCRPNRDPVPRWPCEDASTAFKLCCLSATIYDVRCWGVQGDRDRYVDYSPGDVIGQKLVRYAWSGSPFEGDRSEAQFTINCDAGDLYPNTNLNGNVAFMFPDPDSNPDGFDPQDAVNPWLPCPATRTLQTDQGMRYEVLKTWIAVSWNYSCDTGLVTFRAAWSSAASDFESWQAFYLLTNQLAGRYSEVTADPDWYLDNEIDIPFYSPNDTNRLSRFSVKLRLTCEAQDPCQVTNDCWPDLCPCLVDGTTGEINRTIYADLSGAVVSNGLALIPNNALGHFQFDQGGEYITILCQNNGADPYYVTAYVDGYTFFGTIPANGLECDGQNLVDETVTDGTVTIRFYTL
jgi:hypothetical protein